MRRVYKTEDIFVDPHTAVGIHVASQQNLESTMVVASTADPAKFPELVQEVAGEDVEMRPGLLKLMGMKERYETLPNDLEAVKDHIIEHASR